MHIIRLSWRRSVSLAFGKALGNSRSVDSKTLATLAFRDAFSAEQGLLTDFADLSGPA